MEFLEVSAWWAGWDIKNTPTHKRRRARTHTHIHTHDLFSNAENELF